MKKRVRTQQTNPFYSNEPAVARNQMADRSMTQSASLGNSTPKMVDKKPGKLSGIAGFASKNRPPSKGMSNVPGVKPLKSGPAKPASVPQVRSSGHPGAHRIGSVKPLKLKI